MVPRGRIERFREAQDSPHAGFESALGELRAGGKKGHWIWYVFPQIEGLGTSHTAREFALSGEEEAAELLRDPELRSRLLTITQVVAETLTRGREKSLRALMGSDIDARKVVSSLTLFRHVARKLFDAEGVEACGAISNAAEQVLEVAASQGYPPCSFTLRRIRT